MDKGTLIKAKWLLPISRPPVKDGYVLIADGKIKKTGSISELEEKDSSRTVDLSNHIVMPGLVDIHTHLELSGLKGKIEEKSFAGWVRSLMFEIQDWEEEDYQVSINRGINELINSGVTAVGDISRNGLSYEILKERGLRGTVFLEVLGLDPEKERERMALAKSRLLPVNTDKRVNFGISPHSPYSVSPDLFLQSRRHASECGYPIAVHCSETEDEFEFLKKGTGEIRRMLEGFGLLGEGFEPPGTSPVSYLDKIGVLKDIIGVHMNVLEEGDIDLLQSNSVRVVCCAGSNKWFERKRVCPIDILIKRGIDVSLGTDSLASNNCLNLFFEMRCIKEYFPKIPYRKIIEMATIKGAKALGLDKRIGSLEQEKGADLIAVNFEERDISDPEKYIVESAENIEFMMINGMEVFPETPEKG